jgi:hypothetical protein
VPERFWTTDGIEVPAVTAAQMREIDRIAIVETGPSRGIQVPPFGSRFRVGLQRWQEAAGRRDARPE